MGVETAQGFERGGGLRVTGAAEEVEVRELFTGRRSLTSSRA